MSVVAALIACAIEYIHQIKSSLLRGIAWMLYGYAQGFQMAGLWVSEAASPLGERSGSHTFQVLGHECGHSAFFQSSLINDTVGWILHSSFLVPYFSWLSSHRRNHIYTNDLVEDYNYLPLQQPKHVASLVIDIDQLEEVAEDTSLFTYMHNIMQQLFGFPRYLFANITANEEVLYKFKSNILPR